MNNFGLNILPSRTRQSEPFVELSKLTSEDLDLPYLASLFSDRDYSQFRVLQFLTELPLNPEIVIRRQEVIRDLMGSKELRDALEDFLPLGHELNYFTEVHKEHASPFLQAVWRLGELELYVDATVYLDNALTKLKDDIHSAALMDLASSVKQRREDGTFARLESELPAMRAGLGMKKSVTLGINLDQRLRPIEAGIISINEDPIQEKTLAKKLFGQKNSAIESVVPIRKTPLPDGVLGYSATNFPLSPLFQDLELILKSASKALVRGLKPFSAVSAEFLSEVREDIGFLLSSSKIFLNLQSLGFPICLPQILPAEQRTMTADHFYNPVLALKSLNQSETSGSSWMVLNDLSITPQDGIQILTGPNQGGKTTYIQGLGIMQVLAQTGLPVPAISAAVSVVDSIVTHFPIRESSDSDVGRLGEEAERLSSIFDTITDRSLVLLNESLASTSPAESEYLAEDIVLGLRIYGSRAAYATHLHTLAARTHELNNTAEGSTDIVSLISKVITDVHTAERTYQIVKDAPAGTSYAADIARAAGIDLKAIKSRHKKRGNAT